MNDQDTRTLTEKVPYMNSDELLSHVVKSWCYIEELRRREDYARAEWYAQEEYTIYFQEVLRRMNNGRVIGVSHE